MTRHIALRLFFACLASCTTLILLAIWLGDGQAFERFGPVYFQTTATLFVIGFASFLVWFSLTLRAIYVLLSHKA